MKKITFFTLLAMISTQLNAMTTVHCHDSTNLSYSFENRIGGARPIQGAVQTVEEIIKENRLLYRKVTRIPCVSMPNCRPQQPELVDFDPNQLSFQFNESSKIILESNGQDYPIKTETYSIQFILVKPNWMVCDYFSALYP